MLSAKPSNLGVYQVLGVRVCCLCQLFKALEGRQYFIHSVQPNITSTDSLNSFSFSYCFSLSKSHFLPQSHFCLLLFIPLFLQLHVSCSQLFPTIFFIFLPHKRKHNHFFAQVLKSTPKLVYTFGQNALRTPYLNSFLFSFPPAKLGFRSKLLLLCPPNPSSRQPLRFQRETKTTRF